jgi:hypothetical protein
MTVLKQTTTFVHQFLMVSNVDHVAGKTGLGGAITVYLGKNGAAGVTATNGNPGGVEVDAAHMPGVYSIALTTVDTNTAGSLAFAATGAGADPTNEFHRVDTNYLNTDLSINNSGQVLVSSNLKQNGSFTALFLMTQTGTTNPAPGLTVTGQRAFGVGGFGPVIGAIAEVGGTNNGGGWYVFSGTASDSAGSVAAFKMIATGANESDFTLWFQP